MQAKKLLIRMVFVVEVVAFSLLYWLGPRGMVNIYKLRREQQEQLLVVEKERLEVKALQEEVEQWEHDSFLKEKLAREALHMMKPGEEVYVFE